MTGKEIAYSVKMTLFLVNEYLLIIDNYKERGYILDRLENLEVKIENAVESYIHSMQP